MKLPNFRTITFKEYLDIRKRFISRSIKFLEGTALIELRKNGFKNKKEVNDLLKYQKNEGDITNQMIKWEKKHEMSKM